MPIKFVKEEVEEVQKVEVSPKIDIIKEFINKKIDTHLTFNDILLMGNTKLKTEISSILCRYLSKTLSIVNETIYIYTDELKIYYKINGEIKLDEFLRTYIITYCEESYKKLNETQKTQLGNKPFLGSISTDTLNIIKTNLRVDEKTFSDPKLGQIHFKNGYINLKTQTFHQRKRTDYMTYCIWREYKPSSEGKREQIEKIINQIYPNEGDKNKVLESFAEAMSGYSSKSQYNLFLLGIGSSGKSTLMKMCRHAFKEMVFEFKEDTFAVGNAKADRVLNMLMYNPFIRIMWVNELKGRIDDSLFKQICEGEVNTTTLFQEGQNNIQFNALLVSTMNEFPNIKMDSGVERRLRSLEHKSRFTTKKDEINEEKQIYAADMNLMDSFSSDDGLLNAFVEIIADYAYEFLNGKVYPLTDNFKETKANIVDTNDIVKEFIQKHLEITGNEKDKLSIDSIFDNFKIYNKDSRITKQQLMSSLKDKGLIYNNNIRCSDTSKRGGFINIKFSSNDNEEKEYKFGMADNSALDYGINTKDEEIKTLKAQLLERDNEILLLKKQLEELNKAKVKEEPKPEPEPEQVEVIDEDIETILNFIDEQINKPKKSKTVKIKKTKQNE